MDFTLTEEQSELAQLAATIFTEQSPPERVQHVEATEERVDRELWSQLTAAGIVGATLPESHGGAGLGFFELALILEQQGRAVAPIPLLSTLLGALAIAEHAAPEVQDRWLPAVADGSAFLGLALAEDGVADPTRPATTAVPAGEGYAISGVKRAVSGGHVASALLVTATLDGDPAIFLVEPGDGVTVEPEVAINREIAPTVVFEAAPGVRLGRASAKWLVHRALVAASAIAVGVAEESIARVAEYTSNRVQFGRPLSTNQGLMMECADGFIATEAMRVCVQSAAWRLANGVDATSEVLVAKWWAADGGLRATHIAQHLHGGMGADIGYPIHRYLLWGKQIAAWLGGPQAQLGRLGRVLAEVKA